MRDEESGIETFGLVWPGKAAAINEADVPPMGRLVACPGESIGFETTENLFIEGENLHALKLLANDYAGRVALVYIDPPYNTRSALLYRDDLGDAAWLSMIYPRLVLARRLLAPAGLICVSIGDAQLAGLRLVMDEVFGRENYLNTVSVKTKVSSGASGGGQDKRLKKSVEYVLVFARDWARMASLAQTFTEEPLPTAIDRMRAAGESWKYTSILLDAGERRPLRTIHDAEGEPIEVFLCEPVRRTTVAAVCRRQKLTEEAAYRRYFERIFSDTNAQTSIRSRLIEACGRLGPGQAYQVRYVPRSGRDKGREVVHTYVSPTVRRVIWLADSARLDDGAVIKKTRLGTLWEHIRYNNVGKEGGVRFPHGKKPIDLIRTCLRLLPDPEGLVLDFFAGSCSTAHAVLRQNARDGGRRRFVCVQSPEPAAGDPRFATIAELGRARIRNAIDELNRGGPPSPGEDRGFKVLTLGETGPRTLGSQNRPESWP
jgi:adenine-specific DNA-methyltransferase